MPMKVQLELNKIIETLKSEKDIKSIYLFGSYAYGNPNDGSDIDIAVISTNKEKANIDLMQEYGYKLIDIDMPMDLLVYHEDRFLERAQTGVTMEAKILREGIAIYGEKLNC